MKKIFLFLIVASSVAANSQNVGVGIAAPTRAKFEVHGVANSGYTTAIFGGDGAGISFQRSWPTIGYNQYRDFFGSKYIGVGYAATQHLDPTGNWCFDMIYTGYTNSYTSGARRALTMMPSGNVAVGNSSFNASLTVSRGNDMNAAAYFFGTTNFSAFNFGGSQDTYIRAGKDGGTVFINDILGGKIAIGGFVGINTATPGAPLEIRHANGRQLLITEPFTSNNWEMFVKTNTQNLELYYNGVFKGGFNHVSGSYSSVSDKRLKANITPLQTMLSKVMQLKPVEYEMVYNNPGHKRTLGFIAQEVKAVFPELVEVQTDTTHRYKGINDLHTINYDGFGVIAIKTIQEQQAIIEKQGEAISAMRKKLTELKALAAE